MESTTDDRGTLAFNKNISIGSIPLGDPADVGREFNGEIADLRIGSTSAGTHGTDDKPWVDGNSMPNFSNSMTLDRHGIKISGGDVSLVDKKGRLVDVGSQGIRMSDRSGNAIHDTADAPMAAGNFYVGHLYWFRENTAFKIFHDSTTATFGGNVVLSDWETGIQCVTEGISNARAGLFQVSMYDPSHPGTLSNEAGCRLWMRPTGSGWTWANDSAMPACGSFIEGSGSILYAHPTNDVIMCPLGTNDQVDIYPVGAKTYFLITQLGVYV